MRHKPKKELKRTALKKSAPKKAKKAPKKAVKKVAKKRGERSQSIKVLKMSLDRVFSTFVRLRDADSRGYVKCFTSGRSLWWRDSQNGHFMSRRHNSTRWNEKNCHAQSKQDNLYLSGQQYIYGQNLDKKYGAGTADELVRLSRIDFKLTVEWLVEKIEHYEEEVLRLKKEKNLK